MPPTTPRTDAIPLSVGTSSQILELLLSPRATIRQAMAAMEHPPKDARPAGIALAVNDDRQLLGVVTDGDIRRAILRGAALEDSIDSIMTADPITIRVDQLREGSYAALRRHIHRSRRMMDPASGKIVVVDHRKRVLDLISLFDLLKSQSMRTQTICIVGMGYVGMTLAVAMSEAGLTVWGIEANDDVRVQLESGRLHFHETGLDNIYRAQLGGSLFIGGDPAQAQADVYIVCVGTPVDEHGVAVLADVQAAAHSVARVLKRGDLVVLRSTAPIGTSRRIVLPILESESGLRAARDFDYVFAPERTLAGNALNELRTLPQVIGAMDGAGFERAAALFRELTPSVVSVGSLEEAEAVKLINNAFRDHTFAFANEVALICDRWKLDARRVISAANEGYPRNVIPQPSPGVGGACLSKDPYLLLNSARSVGYEPRLVGHSRRINEYMPRHVSRKILEFLAAQSRDPLAAKIFIAGFAFKGEPETSDIRNSATLDLVAYLRPRVGRIDGYDPVLDASVIERLDRVHPATVAHGFENADCVVVMNNHRSYASWDIAELLPTTNRPSLFFDPWRLFHAADVRKVGGVTYGTLAIDYPATAEFSASPGRID